MMRGSVPTERKARTGLLTPPTRSFSALAKISRERLVSRFSLCLGAVMLLFDVFRLGECLGLGITRYKTVESIVAKVGDRSVKFRLKVRTTDGASGRRLWRDR